MTIGVTSVQAAPSVRSKETSEMLQFTNSGHVLGFHSSGVYIATGNHMLRESFVGAKEKAPQTGQPPAKNSQAQPLGTVNYPELWEGVTLIYDSPPGGILRSTYQIKPWGNPYQITLRYNVPVYMRPSGNLVFDFDTGTMTASTPVAWQEIKGNRVPVDVAFRFDSSQSTVQFSLGYYNPALRLTIDPTLNWNTFMGGSGSSDSGRAIAVDGSGYVYVAGYSAATWGNPVIDHTGGGGNFDAFAAKLNNSGETVWNTFMGSESDDRGNAIAVDGSGNVYVAGTSSGPWAGPWGGQVNAFSGSYAAFATKLNSSGVGQWNTFMGLTSENFGNAIAVDGTGNVYVAGYSYATWGNPVNAFTGLHDAFAAKLTNSGETVWNTFMGSSSVDHGTAIALDDTGNVYVAGYSSTTWGNPVNAHAGMVSNEDAFVAKLSNNGETEWNTFMGSTSDDFGSGIAVDGSGNVYVAGYSNASWGNPVNDHTGGSGNPDAFVAKLNSSGETEWNTFMGSPSYDYGNGIAVDGSGNIYVAGSSESGWGSPMNDYAGNRAAFAAKLNSSGTRQWNTFMGSSDLDGTSIAVDGKANVYVVGDGGAWGNPVNDHAGAGSDAFVAKLLKGALTPGIPLLLLDSSD
ncbi:MAG: SBBP repeat-containing protein [Deltaproteobacteria bacterium]|nr:SBBP repeat-containing protein [Deltaproteobacteria bacterium]